MSMRKVAILCECDYIKSLIAYGLVGLDVYLGRNTLRVRLYQKLAEEEAFLTEKMPGRNTLRVRLYQKYSTTSIL